MLAKLKNWRVILVFVLWLLVGFGVTVLTGGEGGGEGPEGGGEQTEEVSPAGPAH